MKTLREIIMCADNLDCKVMLNVGGKDIEVKEIMIDCGDGTLYLYDREYDYEEGETVKI